MPPGQILQVSGYDLPAGNATRLQAASQSGARRGR